MGLIGSIFLATPASSEAAFRTGLWDTAVFQSEDDAVRGHWFDEAVAAQAGVVRFDVIWSRVARGQPAAPGNPADVAYDFSSLDAAVIDATSRGMDVMLTIWRAPTYAEGPGKPADAVAGTWKPDPGAYGEFARAVATRYSGDFAGLPRVRFYEAWNEPNHGHYFSPQYSRGKGVAVERYRRMLDSFSAAVKDVHRDNVVITGGLAPYGGEGYRTRPLFFLRQLLCLDKELRRERCPKKPRFDVVAHHPINTSGGPHRSALHPDDVSTPDLKHVGRVLRAAERQGTIAGKRKRHPLWATEIWWESNPPDPDHGVDLEKHARRVAEGMYLLWKQGAKVVVNFLLVDTPASDFAALQETFQSGLFFVDGTPKPAYTAFRFPLVGERISGRQVNIWGKAPTGGRLVIERGSGEEWREVKALDVHEGRVFTAKLRLRGAAELRARVGDDTSLVWHQKG